MNRLRVFTHGAVTEVELNGVVVDGVTAMQIDDGIGRDRMTTLTMTVLLDHVDYVAGPRPPTSLTDAVTARRLMRPRPRPVAVVSEPVDTETPVDSHQMTAAEMLDALQAHSPTAKWMLRVSPRGRGLRLQHTEQPGAVDSIRAAIMDGLARLRT